jgi:hypothetical protein
MDFNHDIENAPRGEIMFPVLAVATLPSTSFETMQDLLTSFFSSDPARILLML